MDDSRSGRESPASSDASSEPPEGYVCVLRGFPGSFLKMREVAFVDPIEPDHICVFCRDGSRHWAVTAVSPQSV
ncbi:hypothetical protein MTO96_028977 [Rhipicephalus appendiculatus]